MQIPKGKGISLGCTPHRKSIGSLCSGTVVAGLCYCAKFGWIRCIVFDNMQVLIRRLDGYQGGAAAFRQNSLTTYYYSGDNLSLVTGFV